MAQALRVGEHLCRVIGSDDCSLDWQVQFYVSPSCPHLIDTPRAQTIFLEEDDHRCEARIASSRTGFRKLSGKKEDECYKENTRNILEGSSIKKRILISHILEGN